jgi:hypothetical protein
MSAQVFDVEMQVTVRVTIKDPLVIRRPVENIDNWQGDLYPLFTQDDVLEHLAYNAVVNGRENARLMDGWADLPEDAVKMEVYSADFLTAVGSTV